MIRYDWKLILKESKQDVSKMLKIIEAIVEYSSYEDVLVQSNYPKYILNYLYKRKNRSSFLLNPEKLLNNSHRHTNSELLVYLELASMRNFMDLHFRDEIAVPTYYIEDDYDLAKLKHNTALDVTDQVVRLKYEE